jgi:hypothetical protein
MRRVCVLPVVWIAILISFEQSVLGSGVGDVTIKLNGGANVAYIGQVNTIEIWITNDAQLNLISTCYKIDINQPYTWVKPYGTRPPALPVIMEHNDAVGRFDQTGGLNAIDHIYNTKPDTIHFNGSAVNNKLPVHITSTLCYTMRFNLSSLAVPTVGGVCIDNVVYPPSGYWAFGDGVNYPPTFQGVANANVANPTAPAVCFDIVQPSNVPPVFSNCPSQINGAICALLEYDFNAFDPDSTAVTYAIFQGPGTINSSTGLWSFTPGPAAGNSSLTVRATDGAASTADCTVPLTFFNTPPVFSNSCTDTASGNPGQAIQYDFNATDPNVCDAFSYSLVAVNPTPAGANSVHPTTGLLTYTPAAGDVGIGYTFTVQAFDGDGASNCEVVILAVPTLPADTDLDGIPNGGDNCPHTYNPSQTDSDFDGIGDACDANIVCGDADGSSTISVGDAVYLIAYVFGGGPAPVPVCKGDVSGEGSVGIGDIVGLINYIFSGASTPENCCCPAGKTKQGPICAVNTTGSIKRGLTVDMNGTSDLASNAIVTYMPPNSRILTVDAIQGSVSIDFQVNCIPAGDSVCFYFCSPSSPVSISNVTWR